MRPWQRQESEKMDLPKSIRGQWLFYVIAAFGILFSLLLWYIFLLQDTANLNQLVQVQSKHLAEDINFQFELRIAALKHMAKHLYEGKAESLNNWEDIVEYTHDYGGFSGLVWVDTEYKILQQQSPPNNPNMNMEVQQNVLSHSQEIALAASKNQIWLSSAFNLTSGGKGAFAVIPTKQQNTPKGYLIALINLSDAFHFSLNPAEYSVVVYYNHEKIFQSGLINPAVNQISTIDFKFHQANLRLQVQPSKHLVMAIKTTLPLVALVAGIVISLLFAIAAYLAQLARQRSRSLQKINLDLKKEITDREEAESQKQALEKGLLQGQKLQAIGTLAGGIAHDFNNLLYAIIGYVEMAQEDIEPDSLTHKNLGKVLEASHRGQDLIARILSFSRRHHHELRPLLLAQCVQSVLDLLTPTTPASVTLQFINEVNDDFMIMGDSTRLHQIIVNIVNNAVDAMDAEGVITLKLSVVEKGNPVFKQFGPLTPGTYCRIDITDSGHGMEQSTIERIFEPFFTTKEVGKGTGLGLATVHTIVKEHNGDIVVLSKLGHGTTFTILLPEYISQNPIKGQ